MLKILRQPYPLPEISTKTFLTCVAEGTFVTAFLMVFQPFGIANWHTPNRAFYLVGYGLVTMFFGAIFRFGFRNIFLSYFQEKNWTIGREIINVLSIILLIAIGNYLYTNTIFYSHFSWKGFFGMFVTTVILGIFPTVFGVLFNYIYQLKKYQRNIAVHHSQSADNQLVTAKNVAIKLLAENEKDTLEFAENDLFFIESSDNYSTVYFQKNGKLQKELLRSSLSRLEGQIQSSDIVRCHRSFIVNLAKVERITGNAQGYKLHLEAPEMLVPVARKYSEVVEKLR